MALLRQNPALTPWRVKVQYSFSLAVSLIFLGWVLALYQMPIWGWGLTLVCLLHLSKSGRGALPLTFVWINAVIWVAAFQYATPVGFVWRNAKYWAASLMGLWIMATVIALSIANVPRVFNSTHTSHRSILLTATLMSCGLGLGLLLYDQGISPQ